jgi:hypothetical protein
LALYPAIVHRSVLAGYERGGVVPIKLPSLQCECGRPGSPGIDQDQRFSLQGSLEKVSFARGAAEGRRGAPGPEVVFVNGGGSNVYAVASGC